MFEEKIIQKLRVMAWSKERISEFEKELSKATEAGFDINYLDQTTDPKNLLIITSIINNNVDVLRILIEHGADPNLADDRNMTALQHACLGIPNPEIISMLIPLMKNVNQQYNMPKYEHIHHNCLGGEELNITALGQTLCVFVNWTEVANINIKLYQTVKMLLDAGADPYLDCRWLTSDKDEMIKNNWNQQQKRRMGIAAIKKYLITYKELKTESATNTINNVAGFEYDL